MSWYLKKYLIYMYKSNIIAQACVYLVITLAKPRVFCGKSDMIYDRPSETVPEKLFGSYAGSCYNHNEIKHILES